VKKQRWNGQLVRTILNEHFTNTPIKRQPSSSTLDATSDGESSSLEGPSLEGPSLSGQPLPTAAMILTPTYIRRVGGVAVGLWIYDDEQGTLWIGWRREEPPPSLTTDRLARS
jgi:hypothetical protein